MDQCTDRIRAQTPSAEVVSLEVEGILREPVPVENVVHGVENEEGIRDGCALVDSRFDGLVKTEVEYARPGLADGSVRCVSEQSHNIITAVEWGGGGREKKESISHQVGWICY